MNNSTKGFTILELLVVVAIIGILAAIVMAVLGNSKVSARDAQRLTDLENMQGAVELYFSQNGHYPYTNCATTNNYASFDSVTFSPNQICDTPGGTGQTMTNFFAPYIAALKDPKSAGANSGYLYINNGQVGGYCLMVYQTPENLNDFKAYYIPATRCAAWNSAGQCTTAGTASLDNAIYVSAGATYANGC